MCVEETKFFFSFLTFCLFYDAISVSGIGGSVIDNLEDYLGIVIFPFHKSNSGSLVNLINLISSLSYFIMLIKNLFEL